MNKALEALTCYLNGEIDLDSLEERIIPLAWDDEFKDQDLIDLISIEIAYLNDLVSDESIFRNRMASVAASKESIVVSIGDRTDESQVSDKTGSIAEMHFIPYKAASLTTDYQIVAEFN